MVMLGFHQTHGNSIGADTNYMGDGFSIKQVKLKPPKLAMRLQ